MEKSIYKYSLNGTDCPEIMTVGRNEVFGMEMIKGAEILCVREQPEINEQGIPQITGKVWALVNPAETEKEKRYFRLIETGNKFDDDNLKYIGTYQVYGGKIILHLFECVGKEKINT